MAGNPLAGYRYYYFTTAFADDTTSPEVLSVDPADEDAEVPTSAKITVQMSEALDPISVTADTVVLKQGDTVLSGALSLIDGNRRIQFVPTILLEPLSGHTLTLTGLRDVSGNVLATPVIITFTTGSGADLVSPTVVSTNPAANSTGVVINVTVTAEFSEPVNPVTVNETTVKLYNLTTGQWVDAEVALDASRTVAIFTPIELLTPSTQFRLQITTGVTDTAGNTLANTYVNFTTGENAEDTTPPAVMALSPSDGAIDASVNTLVKVTLSF